MSELNPIPELKGLTYEAAKALAKEHGYSVRARNVNGIPQVVTMDLRGDRINVAVQDDEVVQVYGVG